MGWVWRVSKKELGVSGVWDVRVDIMLLVCYPKAVGTLVG